MSIRRKCLVCDDVSSNLSVRCWCPACEREFTQVNEQIARFNCPCIGPCPHPYTCLSQRRCLGGTQLAV